MSIGRSKQGCEVTHYSHLLLFPVTSKVKDYNCQNNNYTTVTYSSNSVVTALLEMLAVAALLISDENICPQMSDESIMKGIKFWELAKQEVSHFQEVGLVAKVIQ